MPVSKPLERMATVFNHRPRIDTTFGVPIDMNAPSGAMAKKSGLSREVQRSQARDRRRIPQKPKAPPIRPEKVPAPKMNVQLQKPVTPTSWGAQAAKPKPVPVGSYFDLPLGFRGTIFTIIMLFVFGGPFLFFAALVAYLSFAWLTWKSSGKAPKNKLVRDVIGGLDKSLS